MFVPTERHTLLTARENAVWHPDGKKDTDTGGVKKTSTGRRVLATMSVRE